ncbi:MAG: DNA-binding protein [Elusimicrobia bacterium]|nr:DNA-binding protein [Elusimicrobiota bacterium]
MRKLIVSAVLALAASAASAQQTVSGKAAEIINSGNYTYVRVESGKSSSWVATSQQEIKKGQSLSFTGMMMQDFFSKSLNRTFKEILFSERPNPAKGGAGGGSPHGASAAGASPHGGSGVAEPPGPVKLPELFSIKIAKAEGPDVYTVAELYAKGKALNGKKVAVRGKVVKFSEGIMNRNWVHLQDGSGDAKKGTHDLVVTTDGSAKPGETVTVRGVLASDKDFGYGYAYSVIVEKAELKK